MPIHFTIDHKARHVEAKFDGNLVLKDVEDFTDDRDALLKDMEPRLQTLFAQVSKARKGVAICSATRDGLCSVCHVRLRPMVFQLVRQNDSIIQCDSCQRILYFHPTPALATPAITHPQ